MYTRTYPQAHIHAWLVYYYPLERPNANRMSPSPPNCCARQTTLLWWHHRASTSALASTTVLESDSQPLDEGPGRCSSVGSSSHECLAPSLSSLWCYRELSNRTKWNPLRCHGRSPDKCASHEGRVLTIAALGSNLARALRCMSSLSLSLPFMSHVTSQNYKA